MVLDVCLLHFFSVNEACESEGCPGMLVRLLISQVALLVREVLVGGGVWGLVLLILLIVSFWFYFSRVVSMRLGVVAVGQGAAGFVGLGKGTGCCKEYFGGCVGRSCVFRCLFEPGGGRNGF